MENIKNWFSEQWKERKFRVLLMLTLLLILGLCVEFYYFKYSVLKGIRYLGLVAVLFIIAWIDSKEKRIPNKILLAMLLGRVVLLLVECILYKEYWMTLLMSSAMGFLLAGGMFLLCYILTRGGIGAGDVKLFAVLGMYLGGSAIFSVIFLTVVFAAVFNLINLLRKKTDLKQEIPFAPFVFLGTVAGIFLGL